MERDKLDKRTKGMFSSSRGRTGVGVLKSKDVDVLPQGLDRIVGSSNPIDYQGKRRVYV